MSAGLDPGERRALDRQRRIGRWLAPLWVPVCVGIMRFGLGFRVEGMAAARAEYARLNGDPKTPLLVCANHLTMFDSFVIAWALGSPLWYVRHYAALPWNTPEREHFASTWWKRALVYLMKCVPVKRGGDRGDVGKTLEKLIYLMQQGEAALVFPEGGRSRTGRVDTEAVTYGIGRIVKALPGCRVLCVYLRGAQQASWSTRPVLGERFRVLVESCEPKTDLRGLRGSLDLSGQILARLARLEERYFDGR